MNKWSIVGMIAGLVGVVTGWVRYLLIWYDPSQALLLMGLGCCVVAISWMWNVLKDQEFRLYAVEEWLQDNWRKKK